MIGGRWLLVRFVKGALFALMVTGLGLMWSNRAFVEDAYSPAQDPVEIRLSGVDLSVHVTDMGPSPFESTTSAEDTRRRSLALLGTPASEPVAEVVIAMDEGDAMIQGIALGPEGPAIGGVVRIERHTARGIGAIEARVGEDGIWNADLLPGGRYRVRAWVPGQLTMTRSEVFFLEDDGTADLEFNLVTVDPTPVLSASVGSAMFEGQSGEVKVNLTQRLVDAEGLIRVTSVSRATVSVQVDGALSLVGSSAKITDSGVARFTVKCARIGGGSVTVRYGAITKRYDHPGCKKIPPTTLPPPTTRPPIVGVPGVAPGQQAPTRPLVPGQTTTGSTTTTTRPLTTSPPTTQSGAVDE